MCPLYSAAAALHISTCVDVSRETFCSTRGGGWGWVFLWSVVSGQWSEPLWARLSGFRDRDPRARFLRPFFGIPHDRGATPFWGLLRVRGPWRSRTTGLGMARFFRHTA